MWHVRHLVLAGRTWPSRRAPPLRHGGGMREDRKGAARAAFQAGNSVARGRASLFMGLICRWKAPWVRRIVSFFAKGRLMRPWWVTLAWFTAGELVVCVCLSGAPWWVASPAVHYSGLATEGARADRVGAKPPC
jgi:hypothetical protein